MKSTIGFTQAFRTLTIIRIPGKDASKSSSSLFFYPIVGLVLGLICACLIQLILYFTTVRNELFFLGLGALFTALMAILTRGFHLDGLGDMADGFGGAFDKEKILSIMSDSRTGSFGVIAICIVLILKSIGYGLLLCNNCIIIAVYCVVISRTMVVFVCSFGSYAKDNGLSKDLVDNAGLKHSLVAIVIVSVLSSVLLLKGDYYKKIIVCLVSSISSTVFVYFLSYKKIKGVTGDVLGAVVEISECCSVVASSLLLG